MRLLGVNSDQRERAQLRGAALDAASRFDALGDSEAIWLKSDAEYLRKLKELESVDICCVALETDRDVPLCIASREEVADALMLLVADPVIPPTLYLRPEIMASQLLLKPVEKEDALKAFASLYRYYLRLISESNKSQQFFSVMRKDAVLRIPYDTISYFEAREKKLFVCTAQKQTAFYSTLEALESKLPQQFIRCHKSYIVNRDLVDSISFAQSLIYLPGGAVPVSRSYRSMLKEVKP